MKKRITLWMTVIMLFGTLTMFAQKPFVGSIVYEMSAEGTDDPNVNAQLSAMKTEITLMGNNTKTTMDVGIGIINLTNGDYNLTTTIYDIPGMGKYYVEKEAADIKAYFDVLDIKYENQADTKTICGYNCKKVNLTMVNKETDEENNIVLWVTEDLMLGDNINFSQYPGLKGYPLQTEVKTEIESGDMITIITTATTITPSKKVKATNFLRPSDAQPISEAPAELKAMLGIE